MIKKIVITGIGGTTSKNFKFYNIGYTIPVDGVWTDTWLIGSNVTTNNDTTYVCDEFTATISPSTSYSYGLDKLFSSGGDSDDYLRISGYSTPFVMTITLNQPIPAIKNIVYNYYTSNPSSYYINGIEIYDMNDALVFSDDTTWTSTSNTIDTCYLATPDLETTKVYPTNKVGTVETTDVCHITDIYSIDIINPTQSIITNTDVRYLLSFDGRNTYKAYDTTSGSWVTVDTTNIMTQGMDYDTLYSLRSSEYLLAVDTNYRTLDIMVGLITTDETRTPCVNSIRVSYYKITT